MNDFLAGTIFGMGIMGIFMVFLNSAARQVDDTIALACGEDEEETQA